MGAEQFSVVEDSSEDMNLAFKICRERALHDYGHRSYTGTIAEKENVRVYKSQPHPLHLAHTRVQIAQDSGGWWDDKWGPAAAIKLVKGWMFFGWASS